jgi:hypothetical protein
VHSIQCLYITTRIIFLDISSTCFDHSNLKIKELKLHTHTSLTAGLCVVEQELDGCSYCNVKTLNTVRWFKKYCISFVISRPKCRVRLLKSNLC